MLQSLIMLCYYSYFEQQCYAVGTVNIVKQRRELIVEMLQNISVFEDNVKMTVD